MGQTQKSGKMFTLNNDQHQEKDIMTLTRQSLEKVDDKYKSKKRDVRKSFMKSSEFNQSLLSIYDKNQQKRFRETDIKLRVIEKRQQSLSPKKTNCLRELLHNPLDETDSPEFVENSINKTKLILKDKRSINFRNSAIADSMKKNQHQNSLGDVKVYGALDNFMSSMSGLNKSNGAITSRDSDFDYIASKKAATNRATSGLISTLPKVKNKALPLIQKVKIEN